MKYKQEEKGIMRTYVLTHIKGGVLKTTTTINVGYALAMLGYQVLLIDLDPQCNTTYTLTGQMDEETQGTLYEVFKGKPPKSLQSIIRPTGQANLFLAQGSMWLYEAEVELASIPNRETILKRALRGLQQFDYVLIDTGPSLGVMTLNGWYAADALIVPISLTAYGMVGIRILEHHKTKIQAYSDADFNLPIFGVIGTLDDRTKQSAKMLDNIKAHFSELLFNTVIPRNIKVEEANNQSISLFEYAPKSSGAQAYIQLVKEIQEREEKMLHA